MHEVVAECDFVKDSGEELLLVFLYQLTQVDVKIFSLILNVHKTRIQAKFNEEHIDELIQQFVIFL